MQSLRPAAGVHVVDLGKGFSFRWIQRVETCCPQHLQPAPFQAMLTRVLKSRCPQHTSSASNGLKCVLLADIQTLQPLTPDLTFWHSNVFIVCFTNTRSSSGCTISQFNQIAWSIFPKLCGPRSGLRLDRPPDPLASRKRSYHCCASAFRADQDS